MFDRHILAYLVLGHVALGAGMAIATGSPVVLWIGFVVGTASSFDTGLSALLAASFGLGLILGTVAA